MNEDHVSPMTPLDAMISQDSLQLIKAAVPYMNGRGQQVLSIYAKIMELSNTISLFGKPQPELSMMSAQAESMQPADMLNDIRQYAQGPAKEAIDQVLFALNTIQLIQMYQEDPETT